MKHRHPTSLTDQQLKLVMDAAKCMTPDQRHSFLLRIGAKLKLSCSSNGHPTTELLTKVVHDALMELAA